MISFFILFYKKKSWLCCSSQIVGKNNTNINRFIHPVVSDPVTSDPVTSDPVASDPVVS